MVISIHALLAESDAGEGGQVGVVEDFYPRSPCGERQQRQAYNYIAIAISIHALLAESDNQPDGNDGGRAISIHALLAESDAKNRIHWTLCAAFLSTLSLRRATDEAIKAERKAKISIHALLAESDNAGYAEQLSLLQFLSTLSLRRATGSGPGPGTSRIDFYPRSPCGERPCAPATAASRLLFLSTLSLRRATCKNI